MGVSGPVIEIRPVEDFAALAAPWRALEIRADGSFFQSWAWTGCLAAERFPDPWLLSARRDGRIVALALFNRRTSGNLLRASRIFLGESGDESHDSIFIEHNGVLVDRAEGATLGSRCFAALAEMGESGFRRGVWMLSGVAQKTLDQLPASRAARVRSRRPAAYVDLARLGNADALVLDNLSANARQQLRRSLRGWAAIGPLKLDVAQTPEQADAFLSALKALHQRYWTARGKPGAFAPPFFERFHRALVGRVSAGQTADLIRVSAGDTVLGYLYNLVHHGWVAAYQSGFDLGADADRLRPGLVSHLLAIEYYRTRGMRLYDFLGGEARYKRSFANGEVELLWLEIRRRRFAVSSSAEG